MAAKFFFHPDFTVGIGIAPIQLSLADCPGNIAHRRSGITPCPEDMNFERSIAHRASIVKNHHLPKM
jgi:hypothetical protein